MKSDFSIFRNKVFTAVLFFFLLLLSSCKSTRLAQDFDASNSKWTFVQEGLEKTEGTFEGVRWYCIKTKLNEAEFTPLVLPGTKLSKAQNITKIAKQNKTAVCVNSTPFAKNGKWFEPVGIVKKDGQIISLPVERYSAIAFETDSNKIAKKAVVLTNQKEDEIAKYDNVSGGFFRILEKSSIIHFKKIYKPRIVLGTNENGTEIFFFATNSMSYEQCAQVLLGLGCTDALLMDGGSSTQICLNKKQLIHIPFRRKVPTFLGLVKSDSK